MEIFIILLLVILNGLFAMSEIALVSSRKSRLEELAQNGNKNAETALKLANDPEKFLSTVQVGITLIGIVSGMYGGVAFAEDIVPLLNMAGLPAQYTEFTSFTIVVTLITYLSLVLGELVPKNIALNNPEAITVAMAPFMRVFTLVTSPLVGFLSVSTRITLKAMMVKPNNAPSVTEEEIKIMLEKSSMEGVIEREESDMIKSVFRFGDRMANSLMTPRQDIIWIDINDDLETIRQTLSESTHSRYLVCDGAIDEVLGYVHVKDIFSRLEKDKVLDLRSILVEPLYIHEYMPALSVVETFKQKRVYLGIVVNEYGTTEGLVTLHDLIENIFGELPDDPEDDEQSVFVREDGSLLVDGSLPIDELKELLKVKQFDETDEDENLFATLGGFCMYMLNKVPKAGDKFEVKGFTFEIMDMDGKRVDKVLISELTVKEEKES